MLYIQKNAATSLRGVTRMMMMMIMMMMMMMMMTMMMYRIIPHSLIQNQFVVVSVFGFALS